MKLKKKTLIPLVIIFGALLIATTAFADSLNRSAYDQLKDAMKYTSSSVGNGISNLTTGMTLTVRDNDVVLLVQKTNSKIDFVNNASEDVTLVEMGGKVTQNSYNYSDKEGSIWYDSYNDIYYTNKFYGEYYNSRFEDPFKQSGAEDVEKIVDALVGNLKNYITVTEDENGGKLFKGSLSDAQIPALINAVVSFASKQYFSNSYLNTARYDVNTDGTMNKSEQSAYPRITSDIFIKNVNGTAFVGNDGYIQSAYITGVLSGKDEDGVTHDFSLEIIINLDDINTTSVTRPDLTGKKVEEMDTYKPSIETISPKFVGTYKSDIIIDTPEKLVKIGEKILVIEKIEDGTIAGRYNEVYKAGYEEYIHDSSEFTFETEMKDPYGVEITYTDKTGNTQTGNMYFDLASFKIQLWLGSQNYQKYTDSTFSRVFED